MNQRGDFFMNVIIFLGALLILGLYSSDIEPLLVSAISDSSTSGVGTDTYIIIIASSVMILLYAIWQLTKQPDSFSFGA